jgi:hypothetical protein
MPARRRCGPRRGSGVASARRDRDGTRPQGGDELLPCSCFEAGPSQIVTTSAATPRRFTFLDGCAESLPAMSRCRRVRKPAGRHILQVYLDHTFGDVAGLMIR